MKLNKIIKAAAVLVVAATVFAGCKFEGTTASFKADERNTYTAKYTGSGFGHETVSTGGQISSYTSGPLSNVDSKTLFSVTIKSQGVLDTKSIDAALDIYPLTENTTYKYYAPVRGTAFPKTRKTIDVSEVVNGVCTTTVQYEVDLSTVTNNYVAIMANATKLKEKTGKLILNTNGNEKAGEESDSIVAYIAVTSKKSGDTTTATTVLDWNPSWYEEDFAGTFSLGVPSGTEELDTSYKPTGKIKYTTNAAPDSFYNGTDTVYAKDFAAELSKIYSLRTLPMGASKWTESSLTFAWDADINRYVATTDVLAYGTKYCLVTKEDNAFEWADAEAVYGHKPRLSWRKNKKSYGTISEYDYFLDEPEYIIQYPNNDTTAATYSPIDADVSAIASVQDAIIDFTVCDSYVIFEIDSYYYNRKIRFGEYKDFVITDEYLNKIKTKAPVVYETDADGDVTEVLVEIENKNLDMTNFIYWVGEGTTIKANALTGNKEVKFGTPKVQIANTLLGYSKLTN